ncbi:LysR family transcriptional regulator [Dyella flagellata]|uniref:LysR family transcriptional regulator n=1 Tax=Dyella flagellata TaxID=1867833 RepID=A0ABQ5XA58_9GAMM|nr:LysR family transcriptional regulator [Dyella flagellata]GLQ87544.1 LysR family transcriptional regulator [Dyella flagellata]
MDYFAAMRAFVRAAELGSFSRAAEEDGLKVSTVSRYVTLLESDLGAALFNRSTRRLHLTEVGRNFYEPASRILADLSDARLAATALNARPQGLLRINMPIAFGRRHVFRHLPDFLAEYPDIRVDATLTDDTVDLIGIGADVAIRVGALTDSSLVAKRLAPQHRMLVASPGYLARRCPIHEPKDLEDHDCLSFALQPKESWYFRPVGLASAQLNEVAIRGRVRANNSEALLDTALAGLGIALLPTWLIGESVAEGKLQRVLPEWEARIAPGPSRAIWGVYPPKKLVSPKVRAFLAFMASRFGQPPYWDKAMEVALTDSAA